jgi:hypothetical protein
MPSACRLVGPAATVLCYLNRQRVASLRNVAHRIQTGRPPRQPTCRPQCAFGKYAPIADRVPKFEAFGVGIEVDRMIAGHIAATFGREYDVLRRSPGCRTIRLVAIMSRKTPGCAPRRARRRVAARYRTGHLSCARDASLRWTPGTPARGPRTQTDQFGENGGSRTHISVVQQREYLVLRRCSRRNCDCVQSAHAANQWCSGYSLLSSICAVACGKVKSIATSATSISSARLPVCDRAGDRCLIVMRCCALVIAHPNANQLESIRRLDGCHQRPAHAPGAEHRYP